MLQVATTKSNWNFDIMTGTRQLTLKTCSYWPYPSVCKDPVFCLTSANGYIE